MNSQNELIHYGVLGMKWGVRKDPQKAYAKANKKSYKLNKKYQNALSKSQKSSIKLNKLQSKIDRTSDETTLSKLNSKYDKLTKVKDKNTKKANKYKAKAEKWVKSMDKVFGSLSYDSLPQADIDAGKSYTQYIFALEADRNARDAAAASGAYLKTLRG